MHLASLPDSFQEKEEALLEVLVVLQALVFHQAQAHQVQTQVGLVAVVVSQGEVQVEAGNNQIKSFQFNNKSIQNKINEFENKTSVELVTMVVERSDKYPAITPRLTLFSFILLLFFSFGLNIFVQLDYKIIISLLVLSFIASFVVSQIDILAKTSFSQKN